MSCRHNGRHVRALTGNAFRLQASEGKPYDPNRKGPRRPQQPKGNAKQFKPQGPESQDQRPEDYTNRVQTQRQTEFKPKGSNNLEDSNREDKIKDPQTIQTEFKPQGHQNLKDPSRKDKIKDLKTIQTEFKPQGSNNLKDPSRKD